MQQTFKIGLLLAVVCVCLLVVPFIPSIHAQGKKTEKGAREPISKEELIARFQDKKEVDGYVIKGDDIIEIIRDTDLDIRIKNSVIEGGLDFGMLPKTPVEKVRLPETWSDKEKEEWIGVYRTLRIKEIPIVVNEIIIANTEILPIQPFSQSAASVAINGRQALFLSVNFQRSTFSGQAYFSGATFSERANFDGATFSEKAAFAAARFSEAADFEDATFSKWALFSWATFSEEANFDGATFSEKTDFVSARFSEETSFDRASLQEADFSFADLSEATLIETDLKDAILANVNLTGARYEPISAPAKSSLGGITGIKDVWFSREKQSGLVQLRAKLKEAGLRDLEREATYAIEHWKTTYAPWPERYFKRVLFEWTSAYGLDPGRPLLILVGLLGLCAVIYIFPIWRGGKAGIVRIWPKERVERTKKTAKVVGREKAEPFSAQGLAAIGYAFYFSLLSAFHIDFRCRRQRCPIRRKEDHAYHVA